MDANTITDPVKRTAKQDYSIYNEYFPVITNSKEVLSQFLKDRNPELLRLSKLMFFTDSWQFSFGAKHFFRYKENEITGKGNEYYHEPYEDALISGLLRLKMPNSCDPIEKRIIAVDSNNPEIITQRNPYGIINSTLVKDVLQNSNFSVEVVKVNFEGSLKSAKVSNF